ncbi:5-formyltetrahydrofolate cyclo-ligase [Tenacibaculum sp. 190130A14a]|uniref:5-formyltetrahydrofolate cyclo-ligase n=1 Tax=Tenacibaculum polynesiense TaxID=3137857 RepID=A0ABM9PDJ2_9FLAO
MIKKELRKIYKQKRKELTQEQIAGFQQSIEAQIERLDFSKIQNIHIFLPIEKQKEINTYPIIDFLQAKGKNIIISKSNFKDNTLTHFIFKKDTLLEVNNYGIPEPVNATPFEVTEIDLVFVPLLISDHNNYRVGYGKGFYDRFLSECKSTIKTIGLNFFKPIDKISDTNAYDIPLDIMIYPK